MRNSARFGSEIKCLTVTDSRGYSNYYYDTEEGLKRSDIWRQRQVWQDAGYKLEIE